MSTPSEPQPEDSAVDRALPEQTELEGQEQQPEPESIEAPDAG